MIHDSEIKDAVRKNWDLTSETYDSSPGHAIDTREEKDAWKAELRRGLPDSPLAVLDVGCGTGAMGLLFAEMGHRVTGVDLSEAMMGQARRKAAAQGLALDLRRGDAESLPFEDASFDLVVNRHLLWTLPNPEVALKEWYRVLGVGGHVLIIDGIWDDKRPSTRVRRAVGDGLTRVCEGNDRHHRTYDRDLRSHLPHDGGVPREVALAYLEHAGFSGMHFRDLMYIREMQRARQTWYRRIAPSKSYYILSGKKTAPGGSA
jgi:ubiquinone/menaquinone biosynthesis C-methylase UbiE